jgi:hypothetical protein
MRPLRWAVCLGVLLLTAGGGGDEPKVAIRVLPALVDVEMARGEERTFQIALKNESEHKMAGVVTLRDFTLDRDGRPQLLAAGKDKRSLTKWAEFRPLRVAMAAGETARYTIAVAIPRDGVGERYGALIFASEPLAGGNGQRVTLETGTLFFIAVKGVGSGRPAAKVREVGAEGREIWVDVENTGAVHAKLNCEAAIIQGNRVVERVTLDGGTGTTLPGGVRRFRGKVSDRAPGGAVRIQATVRYDKKVLATGGGEATLAEIGEPQL